MKVKKKFPVLFIIMITVVSVSVFSDDDSLIILHTNDIHGRISVADDLMGMPYISSVVKDYRSRFSHVLVLDAGDALHGRPITDKLEGESAVKLMNKAGYTAMAPGNHDFNYGYQKLIDLTDLMKFELLAANVLKDGELLFTPYIVIQRGNRKIGIFGLATSATYTSTHPDNVKGIEFTDMIEASEKYTDILINQEHVDFVIALTHVGLSSSTSIAEAVEGIDLVIDGHSHSLLHSGQKAGNTLIVQANEYTKYLGKVEVDFSGPAAVTKASLITAAEVKEQYQADPELEEMLEEFGREVTAKILGF